VLDFAIVGLALWRYRPVTPMEPGA
jgi:hypothetical protein